MRQTRQRGERWAHVDVCPRWLMTSERTFLVSWTPSSLVHMLISSCCRCICNLCNQLWTLLVGCWFSL
ncbi:hypothetical protein VFPPC_16567 [Pochonia chlamydosporia 170]|uniref:Uncharacterized protein n=1 Tax=Pochonia chlamydosporia 170 TaxID=1380566 RepID=A0A179F9V2_METCM|nr:hypothetical protein VFPPC_16567 [Pochonia chlamydosporia 170]OAQ61853.1 hypothetical protein VFPPC_16567 [Pochonia chlamydosporia 170]